MLRIKKLDELNKSINETFRNDRTILHYAADHADNGEHGFGIAKLLVKESRFEYGKELLKSKDKYGRTALHIAAFHGHIKLCKFLIKESELKMIEWDANMENSFHFAVNGNKVEKVDHLFYSLREEEVQELILSRGAKGKTALHKAAANGNKEMIEALLALISNDEEKTGYISESDWFGETALHEAARGGHIEALKCLLQHGSAPLLERNDDDKTALHYAVQLEDITKAKQIAEFLSDHLQSNDKKTLFLGASASGVGTAEESATKEVREFLQTKTPPAAAAGSSNNLLRTAIEQGLEKSAWEIITRRGDVKQIKDSSWAGSLNRKHRQRLDNILQHMDAMPEVGRDQPTGEDSLGRIHFAEGLGSLFLNPFVKTPVTVGISGDWGMGKSSLMVQTEIALLKAAAQLAFPNLLQIEKFPGFKQWEFSKHGQRKYEQITKAVKHLLMCSTLIPFNQHDEDPLVHLLENYQEQYHDVYRSLAVMDRREMFQVTGERSQSRTKVDTLGKIPAILTVQYNAWHYQSESEAWAGLAVEITKVIEETMNTAQTIRTCCRYAWKEQRGQIYFVLILPCLLLSFVAVWIVWAAWLLISRSNDKQLVRLKYGCIPVTIIAIAWTVFRQLFSVMKPISHQIMTYVRLPDHSGNLGYQQKVISDIKFLKAQIGENPTTLWKFIAGQWCWNWFGLFADTVKDTRIPKLPPAPMDDLRIIVFVDDLDRCQDKVILEVLSAVNLVLAACEINCILGMDQKMIARAIANKFEQRDEKVEDKNQMMDLANKYLTKIVQLPLALPDPNNEETTNFLYRQLGVELKGRFDEPIDSDDEAEGNRTTMAAQPQSSSDAKSISQGEINSDAEEDANRTIMTVQSPPDAACHVAVNLGQNERQRPIKFWLKVCHLLEPCRTFTKFLAQLLKSNGTKTPPKVLLGAALNSVLLMSKYYSPGEREALSNLQEFATEYRKLPREWKRFLTYHRLTWNILSKSGQVKSLANWQVQLVVWIFCCWLWKYQMHTIIEKWQELEFTKDDTLYGNASDGPSLSDIVECHVKMKYGAEPRMETVKDKLYYQSMDLKLALNRYDVSMDCIQAFQKFRLHCEVGHLHRIYYGI